MAIAGRVAIVPKGDWSADATYKRLDAVTHNNTLYFAKKDVPAGTETSNTEYWSKSVVGGAVTVDDTLSSTSTNPVQNKVVTSNLTNLKYGEVAGGKNLIDVSKVIRGDIVGGNVSDGNNYITDFIHLEYGKNYILSNCYKSSYETAWFTQDKKFIQRTFGTTITPPTNDCYYVRIEYGIEQGINAQLEEGSTETSYEPYIQSVKMLAEENAQQSTETMDLKMLGWTVPREYPIQNEVNGNQFIQKVGRVDLGSLDWNYATNPNRFNADFNSVKFVSNSTPIVAYSTKYDIYSFDTAIYKDKTISVCGSNDIASFLVVIDSSYTDAESFKQAMQGQYLYYELATPINKTIDGNEIGENKLDKDNVVNNQTTTEEGFALDARQANPNVEGSLGAQIKAVNSSLNSKKVPIFSVENVITDILVYGSDGEFITPNNTWEASHNHLSCVVTNAPAGQTSISATINVPANSIVLLSACDQSGPEIRRRSPDILSNIGGDSTITRTYNLYLKDSVKSTHFIDFYPLVIHLG